MPEVRLIDSDGAQLGVVKTFEALRRAQEQNLDLVEVSPLASPPVCKIVDFGHLIYQQNKQKQTDRKKQKAGEIKGIRLSYNMGKHDIELRIKQASKFLLKGHKVKVEMILRGRQKAHPEHVKEVFDEFKNSLELPVISDQPLKRMGHKMIMVLTAAKK